MYWKYVVPALEITSAASKHWEYLVLHPSPPSKIEDAPQFLGVPPPILSLYHHLLLGSSTLGILSDKSDPSPRQVFLLDLFPFLPEPPPFEVSIFLATN